jgi:hypothetical protein
MRLVLHSELTFLTLLAALAVGGTCPATHAARVPGAPMPLLGAGPVYPGLTPPPVRLSTYDRAPGWLAIKTIWAWPPRLLHRRTRVLVRAQRLDGLGPVRFQLGPQWDSAPLTRELRLDTTQPVGGFSNSSWGTTVTMILVKTPGCYALTLAAGSQTTRIVFSATR